MNINKAGEYIRVGLIGLGLSLPTTGCMTHVQDQVNATLYCTFGGDCPTDIRTRDPNIRTRRWGEGTIGIRGGDDHINVDVYYDGEGPRVDVYLD